MEKNSLFERLGGSSSLEQVSSRLTEKLQKDKNFSHMFQNLDIKKLNENRRDYLASIFGGPSNYKGKSLSEAHKQLGLKEGDFNMFIFYFKQTLSEMKIDQNVIEEAARLLEPKRGEILSEKSLFERLGGDEMFNRFGDLLGKKILADSLLGPIYSKTDFKKVNEMRMQYIRSLFGGKGEYQGRNMREAHSKENLNDKHFNRFIYLFKDALAELNVKKDLMQEAVNMMETTRNKITNKPSLFEEIGGYDALERIVANFQNKFKHEPTLAATAKGRDLLKIREGLKRYYGSVLGGPRVYTGKNLREAHSELKINDQQFNLYLKLLRKALLEEGVKENLANQFLEALDLSRNQVIGRKSILERLGGMEGLSSIMKEFHESMGKDKLLGPIYEEGDPHTLVNNYTHYFSYLFGEMDPHVDQSLDKLHGPLKLKDVHFDLFIDLFIKTLKNFKLDEELINEVQDQLEKRRNDVLQRKPLWERLGGEQFMDKACRKFVDNLMKDPVLGPMHKNIDVQKYHENHMDLFADLFGGYHFYSGRNLKDAHRTLKANDEDFDLFVKLFQQALKDSGVKQELLEEVREKMEFERNEVLNRRSLYEKMGGEPAIDLFVEKLHALIANDPDIGPFHKNVDWAKLHLHRKQFFIQIFGSLNVYQGKDLRTAHSDLKLNDKHFEAFMKLVKTALSQAGVQSDLIEQALMLLEGTRREVLNNPSIFEKMGGKEGLMKFVKKLDDISIKDPKLSKFFEKIDRSKLDEHQFQYFSNMFGGPKMGYEGKSVRTAHENLPLSDEHFKVYLERTQEVLKDMNVEKPVVEEALRMFQNKRNEVLNQ